MTGPDANPAPVADFTPSATAPDQAEAGGGTGESAARRGPPRPRSRRRLSSIANVRTALADILWKLEQHEVEAGHARALIYGYSVLAGVIQGHDLEQRIKNLEARA